MRTTRNGNMRLDKDDFIAYWKSLTERALKMSPIAYKHKGSTYDEDSIRITGNRDFIDAVLFRIKDLIQYENSNTRLSVNYQQTIDRESKVPVDSWNCYIQVHQRGDEAKMMNAFIDGIKSRSKRVKAEQEVTA